RVVVITVERINSPVAFLLELLLDKRIKIVSRRLEITTEFLFRVIMKNRENQFTIVAGNQRFVVGDKFGKQADDNQYTKHKQACITAPAATETQPDTSPRRYRGHS